jgi:hypothetical protein
MSSSAHPGEERLRLREDALEWREVEGEIVALDVRTSRYVAVNPTGAVIWSALAQGATRAELAGRVSESFDVDEATAARDVDAFLDVLAERDLLA